MSSTKTRKPKIGDLKLSAIQLAKAKDFVEELGIGVKDDLYYYALLWCKENELSNGDFLTSAQRIKFDKDVKQKKKSPLIQKILGEIALLETLKKDDSQRLQTSTSAAAQRISASRGRKPQTKKINPPPKVTISIDKTEAEKGEEYTVSWKSENAIVVSRSFGFYPKIVDTELSGSKTITANRVGSKTYGITVRNSQGRAASATTKIQVVEVKTQPDPQKKPPKIQATVTKVTRTTGQNQALVDINNSLTNIVKMLAEQNKTDVKSGKTKQREDESERRKKRQAILETSKGIGGKLLEKPIAKVMNIFQSIMNFIFLTLLGRLFTEFINWASDPKNAGKVKAITRFLKDFWMLIGGAAALFFTPLGSFLLKTLKILKFFGGILLKHPLIAIGAGIGLAASTGYLNELKYTQETEIKDGKVVPKRRKGNIFEEVGRAFNPGQPGASFVTPMGFAYGGIVTPQTGITVKGAGVDTQLVPIEGGGSVVLQKGEAVLQKGARERMISATGIDPLMFNIGSNANNPKTISNKITAMSTGGIIGGKGPKLSGADYSALLAIASAEDFANPQGRADVAQSLYNRLFASKAYGMNYNPTDDNPTLKNLITGPGQFEPTFKNREDWLNIKDKNTAAIALSRHKNIPTQQALKIINDTDKILRNPVYQENARQHVQGRTFFLGSSQHKNMKPEKGDVTRGPDYNFFSHWHAENTPYQRERGKIPAPLPVNVVQRTRAQPRPKPRRKSAAPQRAWWDPRRLLGMKRGGMVDASWPVGGAAADDRHLALLAAGEYIIPRITVRKLGSDFFDNIVARTDENSNAAKITQIPRAETPLTPLGSSGASAFITLPPIMQNNLQDSTDSPASHVPSFGAVSPMATNARSMLAEIYGIGS